MASGVEDRLLIRERIEAYGDAVFRRDAEAWSACWAEDAVWGLVTPTTGKPAIRAAWEQAMSAFSTVVFLATVGDIEVTGDQARARVYTHEVLVGHDGAARQVWGAYEDTLVRLDGVWLFSSRTYRVLYDA